MSNINLSLDVNDTNTILSGLAELPAKVSYDVINKVKSQAENQLKVTGEGSNTIPPGQQLLQE